jgi:hypothetical protein
MTYRERTAVERGFGRLKHQRACARCGSVCVERVTLHAHPTILAQLASALAGTRDT